MFNVFPQGLEGTLVIPIFIGVLVMAALNEAWGWDFVGVVVPGYLAAISLLEPTVALVVIGEALCTWLLAAALDRGLTAARLTFPVFGRDRFFLILAASVAVRIALEGFVLQSLATRLSTRFPALEAHRHDLFGIGLVLVPLAANRLWAAGVRRGLYQLLVQVGVVVLILRFVLLPFTNFALAGFDPTYDPLALAFLTSPRAQMALLVTAAVASLWNRRYGWDYHGILVPALLGLAVLAPVKLLATVVEALVILLVARALLWLPRLRTLNVEGARRVVLCFCVGVTFKMATARLAVAHLPGYRPTDLLGFGYVLPSLLAERIWLKKSVALVFVPTVQTAAVGFALTTVGAALLALVAPVAPAAPAVFPSLTRALAAWQPRLEQAADADLSVLIADRAPDAQTADGYRLLADPRARGLVALRGTVKRAVIAPLDERAATGAVTATRAGSALVLGEEAAARALARALGLEVVPPSPASGAEPAQTREPWQVLARRAAAATPGVAVDSSRVLAEDAALMMDRERDDPERLARAAVPFGLRVTAAGGAVVLAGPGWPTVILRPGAAVVAGAAHASEFGSAGAAVLVCETLAADCVLPADDGSGAAPLAAALAQRRGRPLALVRGTTRPLGADALLLAAPEPGAAETPAWIRPVLALVDGRVSWARRAGPDLGTLRAFPPGAGRLGPVALLWLSPFARRVMSGADQAMWSRPELAELARSRGIALLHADAARWVAAGRAAPDGPALGHAELIARTGDVAMLGAHSDARMAVLIDEAHGVAGLAVEQGGRRALVVGGDRREERLVVGASPDAEQALRRGVRTLLAGGPR
jgi:hypothetical protein